QWCVLTAERSKCRIKLAERRVRQVRLGRITQFQLVEMAQREVKIAEFGRELRFLDERACEMQLVPPGDLITVHQDTALGRTSASPAPGIVKCPEIRHGCTPGIAASRLLP